MTETDFRLPDLRFVPTEALFPHEYHDLQRTQPLVERLRESGTLKNPPIVTQVGDGMRVEPRFVVLDGANRSTAARAAGWPHARAGRALRVAGGLHTWYHALTRMREILERGIAALPGLDCQHHDRVHARALLARREHSLVLTDGDVLVVQGGRTLHERNVLLNSWCTYWDRLPYTRVTSDPLTGAREPECRRS
jgi:hypothetical protein